MKNENQKYVRLTAIELENIKNIDHGRISFPIEENIDKNGFNNAFGIYGPNGSGKTSLISALNILKTVLLGQSLNNKHILKLININHLRAKLAFDFIVFDNLNNYKYRYELNLVKLVHVTPNNLQKKDEKVFIEKESLYLLNAKDPKSSKKFFSLELMSSDLNIDIYPETKYEDLLKDKVLKEKIAVQKITSNITGVSFLFSNDMLSILEKSKEYGIHFGVLKLLIKFATVDLFVIDQAHNNDIFLNLTFRSKSGTTISQTMGTIINYRAVLADTDFYNYEKSLKAANILLQALIPGLQIVIDDETITETTVSENTKGKSFELVSIRNGKKLPLALESNGIKSIFSVASLLISAYNDRSITVAIDEYDSGIFEYLLGDILDIYKVGGKGLFIFTSHNLRPLEILGKKRIYFTCNKEKERFSLYGSYVQPGTNFRNEYIRSLFLGSDDEPFAFRVRKSDIRKAFVEANKVYNE